MRDAPVHQIETCLHQGLESFPAALGVLRGQDDIVAVADQCEMRDVTAIPHTTGMMDFFICGNGSVKDFLHQTVDTVIFPSRPHPSIILSIISAKIMEAHRVFVDVYPSIDLF